MRILLDFKCTTCSNVDERLVELTEYVECSKCNGRADRLISKPTVKLEGYSGSFPSAAAAWEKKHSILAAQPRD
jgi:predicted nucleic acid-binding Zn ribbon protein